jgi:hypothetical protein
MFHDDDADTIPGGQAPTSELVEAVEWLRSHGFLSGEERPFAHLIEEAHDG